MPWHRKWFKHSALRLLKSLESDRSRSTRLEGGVLQNSKSLDQLHQAQARWKNSTKLRQRMRSTSSDE